MVRQSLYRRYLLFELMIGVEIILLVNTGIFSIILFVLLLSLLTKSSYKIEERVYLSKDMHKIKENVSDVEEMVL